MYAVPMSHAMMRIEGLTNGTVLRQVRVSFVTQFSFKCWFKVTKLLFLRTHILMESDLAE